MSRFLLRVATLGVALAMATPAGAAGDLAPMQVFTDGVLDGDVLLEATPPVSDLVAGYISESATAITVTWEVLDIPDETGQIPEAVHFYFEFSLDNPADTAPPGLFSLRARLAAPGQGTGGSLRGNCTTTGTVVQCQTLPATVTVSVDAAANQISATVLRADLKVGSGPSLAVDDATLDEAVLFQGIGSFVGAVLIPAATGDLADLDDTYVLGTPRT